MAKKLSKATVKRGHRIARGIIKSGSKGADNPWAVGMSKAKELARRKGGKRKR